MKLRKIIENRIRSRFGGSNVAGDIHAVIAANTGESGAGSRVSSRSRHRVVQRGGRTIVDEHEHETDENDYPKEGLMAKTAEYRQLTREELEKIAGEPLPERAAMSLINANVAAPVNAALALNVLSDDSTAFASAVQNADITQEN